MDATTLRQIAETFTYDDSYINGQALEEAMMEAFNDVSSFLGTSPAGDCILKESAPISVIWLFREIENVQHNFPDLFES